MLTKTITIQNQLYHYYALNDLAPKEDLQKLPYSLKILLENVYRNSHTQHLRHEITQSIIASVKTQTKQDIPFYPARVLMQDFTGVPAIVDLAALRDAALAKGADPKKINPLIPVDLIIDHSVTVEQFASPEAFEQNVKREYQQNLERYQFLNRGRQSFKNYRFVPPVTKATLCIFCKLFSDLNNLLNFKSQLTKTQTKVFIRYKKLKILRHNQSRKIYLN